MVASRRGGYGMPASSLMGQWQLFYQPMRNPSTKWITNFKREHLDTAPGVERGLSRPQQRANRQRAWICPKLTTAQRMLRPGKAALRVVRPVGKGAVSRPF